MPLGSLQKGSFEVTGAVVEMVALHPPDRAGPAPPEWMLRIKPASYTHPIELGVESKEEAIDWCNTIK